LLPPSACTHALLQLHVEAAVDSANQLVLDSRDLSLHAVQLLPSGQALQFSMGQPHKVRCWLQSINQVHVLATREGNHNRASTLKPPVAGTQPAGQKANEQGPDTAKLPIGLYYWA
jgi:hypothetical protein